VAILDPGETREVMQLIEEPQTQALAEARDGAQPVERVGVVRLRRLQARQCRIAAQPVVVVKQRQGNCKTLLYRGIGKPRRATGAVRLVSQLLADFREGSLPLGLLDRREPLRPR